MVKADPVTLAEPVAKANILEGHDNTIHWNIAEDKDQHESGQQKKIHFPVAPHASCQPDAFVLDRLLLLQFVVCFDH